MNVPKHYLPSGAAVSLGRLGLFMAVCLALAPRYYGIVAHAAPRQSQSAQSAQVNGQVNLSAKERRVRDEAAIRGEVLRLEAREQSATHVGMEEGSKVVDPSREMMRNLLAARPSLQPASALVKPGVNGQFTLITVSDVEWQSKNRGQVCGIYRTDGSGGSVRNFSSHGYVATRGKVRSINPTGWVLKHTAIGCGPWDKFTILYDGTPTVIKCSRRQR